MVYWAGSKFATEGASVRVSVVKCYIGWDNGRVWAGFNGTAEHYIRISLPSLPSTTS